MPLALAIAVVAATGGYWIQLEFGQVQALAFYTGFAIMTSSLIVFLGIWFFLSKNLVAFAFILVVLKMPAFAWLVWQGQQYFKLNYQLDATGWLVSGVMAGLFAIVVGLIRAFYLV